MRILSITCDETFDRLDIRAYTTTEFRYRFRVATRGGNVLWNFRLAQSRNTRVRIILCEINDGFRIRWTTPSTFCTTPFHWDGWHIPVRLLSYARISPEWPDLWQRIPKCKRITFLGVRCRYIGRIGSVAPRTSSSAAG